MSPLALATIVLWGAAAAIFAAYVAFATIVLWGAAAAMFAAYVALYAGDISYVTLADGRRQERSLPLLFKLLLPFAGNFDSLVARKAFAKSLENAQTNLVAAGFDEVLSAKEFLALRFLVPIVATPVWCAFMVLIAQVTDLGAIDEALPALCLLGAALFAVQPAAWLSSALKKRHTAIMRALPFVLDVLTLSVEAGMDFISALQRNCSSRKIDALNEELVRMIKEIQLGMPRREALTRMADRTRQPDLRSVVYALVQADELGVSIGSILRIQADQLRARRFDRAERLAAEAPTKMLMPLMLCIFPAVFIILLGPVLSQAMKGIF